MQILKEEPGERNIGHLFWLISLSLYYSYVWSIFLKELLTMIYSIFRSAFSLAVFIPSCSNSQKVT